MKDLRYHVILPFLAMPLVALVFGGGLWLSVRNTLSRREAVPVARPTTPDPGYPGLAGAPSRNDRRHRVTGRTRTPTTTRYNARWQADRPAPLPQRRAGNVSQVQRFPLPGASVLIGLNQAYTQRPRLESTSLPRRSRAVPHFPAVTHLREQRSAELQPPPNYDPAEIRLETSLPEFPPDSLAIESKPRELPEQSNARRSWNTELMAREADSHTRRGFDLAGRGAIFSARTEFIIALRLVAEARDADHCNTKCSRALAAALTALEEAEDFLPLEARTSANLDLSDIIRRNSTPVLRNVALDNLTAHTAVQSYLSFAQEQLAASAGSEVAGSMALYGLGKLHGSMAHQTVTGIRASLPKAVVFYQAALLAMPQNHLASNDLGVLLARGERYEDARVVMNHGLAVHQSSAGWRNLGLVLWQLGQTDSSRAAHKLYLGCLESEQQNTPKKSDSSGKPVRWVDPNSFAKRVDRPQNARREPRSSSQPPKQAYRAPRADAGRRTTQSPAIGSALTPPTLRPGILSEKRASEGVADNVIMGVYFTCLNDCQTPRQQVAESSQAAPAIRLCQALGPAAPCNICGVDCSECDHCQSRGWESMRAIAWQAYAQGEYVGHERPAHVTEYRLRVDDELDLIYRLTRDEQREPYKFNVGDEIRVESITDDALNRDLLIQPDGTITLRGLGQVPATGRTVAQLTENLETLYLKFYHVPAITVTPLKVNTKLEDLRATVDRRQGFGGQSQTAKVTPEGTIALPAIGHVRAQGLTLSELQRELNERYRAAVNGMEVIPALVQRAPRYVYVMGEVAAPGRFELTGPTTVTQALAMAGSWNNGAQLKQIVIFRRGDGWQLLATMIDLHDALHGKQPCPAGEIWLSDSDVVIVPKSPILVADDFIELVFTRGIYGVFPLNASLNFATGSSL